METIMPPSFDDADPPLVSVVIPTYNRAASVVEAIDSTLAQTYPAMEIIVVDDGSTDDTREVVPRRYPQVRYFHQENGGVATARNFGIREARGEFVAFLDSDDLWLPGKTEKQVACFKQYPDVGLVYTDADFFDDTGPARVLRSRTSKAEFSTGDMVVNLFTRFSLHTPTVMMRKAVFETVGYFDEELRAVNDDNLWIRVAVRYPLRLIAEPLVHVRRVPGHHIAYPENSFNYFKKHLELIQTRYPEVAERLGPDLIRWRTRALYRGRAYTYFTQGQLEKARMAYKEVLQHFPWDMQSRLYFACAHLPVGWVDQMRSLKQKMG